MPEKTKALKLNHKLWQTECLVKESRGQKRTRGVMPFTPRSQAGRMSHGPEDREAVVPGGVGNGGWKGWAGGCRIF